MSKKSIKKLNASGKSNCDICGESHFLEEHHIRGRKIKNANHAFNLSNICSNCHYEVHLGEIIIENWVSSTSGRMLIWHKKGEESVTGNDALPYLIELPHG